jgi:hypothetical protein
VELLAVFVILALSVCLGAWAMNTYRTYTQPERERALRAELDAMHAAQRLSLAAWQARQQMAEIVRDDPADGA